MRVPNNPDVHLAFLAAAVLFGLGVWWGRALTDRRVRLRLARHRRLGRRAERRALRLLRRRGFRVIAVQVEATVRVRVDGRVAEFPVRADALARRWFRRYVVEIKSGAAATVAHRGTRRQLLEYGRTFRCGGVLLVDATRGRIRRVEFL